MSLSPKEILLAGCDVLMYGLNHVVFNVALLGATCAHMVHDATHARTATVVQHWCLWTSVRGGLYRPRRQASS